MDSRISVLVLLCLASACAKSEFYLKSETSDEGISITEGGSKVLFYQMKPKSLDGRFERASYIHPLYSFRGNVITEDFPEDHPHHHGIYSAWHQIMVNGKQIADGWTGENLSWEVTAARVQESDGVVEISSNVLWKSTIDNDNEVPVVNEDLTIAVHAAASAYRIIDYNFTLTALVDSLRIGGSDDNKGYGGFSLRLKLPGDIRFQSTTGEVQPQVVSVDAGPWMHFSGSFDGSDLPASGVVVFSHPSNPGSPQPWILRKEKSMQNPAFPGRTPVLLNRSGLSFRYRVIVYKDVPEEGSIRELYSVYTNALSHSKQIE